MEALGGITNIDVLPHTNTELFFISSCYTSSTIDKNDHNNVKSNNCRKDISYKNNDNIICRFCFSGDEMSSELGDWITPCKCSGSIKFVHRGCFNTWMNYASNDQRYQCRLCGFTYIRIWKLKPLFNWTLPKLNLTCLDIITMFGDFYATSYLYDGFLRVLEGDRSLVVQGIFILLYKNFVLTRSRIGFYNTLFRNICFTIFSEEFANAR
ncbi:Zinc finger, RING-CH-type domain and Zinc finger, RING/FYVE/PHD-type domain-containing protein [Strongyloides ratti]|uniref:Zinc finger, RING-CH-type domain and Zinc finger, RING/FYVE/PHD-type domain-containing protein n=1 Tax=Strongyloides ratti TaxID=34506 RepID=A0A090L4G3_STRRB|nr:Zinc finger, RING-CH-type domain and Zinc finger, RING/FYVE/PHD-type domain-containing protein [Strongyloides ratti]CEF62374.1 Zinc finger, RING-CH-type domain and Zinc finger, RING/FYVE/PHD-type domain-containing protein [Strongyloides ratti]